MPSIKCDICGGNIIMQANKTGVCQNCGLEYDIKAIKAMVSKGTTEKSFVKSGNQKQDDVDRDCLLIYLNDLRVMETVMQCSRRNAEQLLDRSADNEAIVKQLQQTLEERESHLEELNKPEIESLLCDIETETKDISELLSNAYSANIIPMQFRNIEGVYYLYDYLSTSNQSLSEALMQANLESIKQKLDDMIQIQSEQVIQQAQANAKLGKIIEISEDVRNNAAVAAKYAQITAVNSALNAKLAAKQLSYQKAEFWLN